MEGKSMISECRYCDEWCESEFCSDECAEKHELREIPL